MSQPHHHHAPTPFGLTDDVLGAAGVPVVAVRGELDIFTAPELRDRLRARIDAHGGACDLVVDLSECAFVDASGCRVLLRAGRRLAALGRRLAIINTRPETTRIFAVMGLDELFDVFGSRVQAAAALNASGR